ncbi:MAG: hypothetical protein JRI55_18125, partial [Deltaproteobacteria bacterium]|nr:hypothetical protein [Deltaproteobacteria bacterium]
LGLAVLAVLYIGAARPFRPVVLLPLFADQTYLHYALGGVTDLGWTLLLLGMLVSWRRPSHRAIWYGLACAYKHQPWVLAPFLLIRIWKESSGAPQERWRALGRFAGVSTASFLVVNLPFIIWSPSAWFAGVAEPVLAPMITLGQGLSSLTMLGVVMIPKWVYSALLAAVLVVSLVVYWRHHHRMGLLLWIAPGLVLWFSHRSLNSYWYFFAVPLLYELLRPRLGAERHEDAADQRWQPTAVAAAALLVTVSATVGALALTKPELTIHLTTPLRVRGNHVVRMTASVSNASDEPVTPRFSTQSSSDQPFFWRIDRGPRSLSPGQRATYELSTGHGFARFDIRRGARVTVTDASRYGPRGTTVVPGEPDFAYPDGIPNGQFRYWDQDTDRPAFWGVIQHPPQSGRISPIRPAGEGAPPTGLRFALHDATSEHYAKLSLDTYVMLPETEIDLFVHPPAGANELPDLDVVYGLQVAVSTGSLWVLFGDDQGGGRLDDGTYFRFVQAPQEAWSRHRIDVRRLLREAGVEPAAVRTTVTRFEHLDFATIPANVDLIFASRRGDGEARADFGPLRTHRLRPSGDAMTRHALAHPEEGLIWSAELNLEARNYRIAADRFTLAAEHAPDSGPAHFGLAEARLRLGEFEQAALAYQQAIDLEHRVGLAAKGLGWALYELGRHEQALAAFTRAAQEFRPRAGDAATRHRADALKGMSMSLVALERCLEGSSRYGEAMHADPSLAWPKGWFAPCQEQTAPD